jgi:hypothetical protein
MSREDMAPIEPSKPRLKLLAVLGTLLGVATFLLAVLWINQWTRARIANLDRYTLPFADIDCPPPPDQSRAEFLAEVQYLGGMPDRLHLLDDDLPSRLQQAFACHPSVERVVEVRILPPRRVQIRLIYRTPDRVAQ